MLLRLLKRKFLYRKINDYISSVYEEPASQSEFDKCLFQVQCEELLTDEIDEAIKTVEKSFSDKLLEIIHRKNLNEVKVYKKADIDRRLFSKIRSDSNYKPAKDTAILLCLSMELSLDETQDLLNRAGYTLSRSNKQDIIAEYFFRKQIYDIYQYKSILYKYGFIKKD